jgi:hypothetical protein
MADVFISSAKADRDFVWQLASYLRSQARTVWWDADNRGRDYVAGTVERELESAHKVIVLWTRASITSPFILHEAIAAHDAGKLVQVKASDVQVSNLPRALRGLRILDATDFTAITRAVSVQEDSATELPLRLCFPNEVSSATWMTTVQLLVQSDAPRSPTRRCRMWTRLLPRQADQGGPTGQWEDRFIHL